VTQENYGGRGWGIGVGLVLGIILALLSLLRLPFVGGRGLRSAAAAKTSSETVDDRLGERPLPNSEERDARNLPQPDLDWTKTAVQSEDVAPVTPIGPRQNLVLDAPGDMSAVPRAKRNAEFVKTVRLAPSGPQRLPIEASRPTSLPPISSPSEGAIAGEEPEILLQHARFLIKAGLAPLAPEPLRKIVREAPGTPIAQEAQRTLDSLSRN